MEYDFSFYGFSSSKPPELHTAWNEQKRVVDLSQKSYVFITSLYSSPWRLRERFPNADRSTLFYYWHKWGEKRIKRSLNWFNNNNSRWPSGISESSCFKNPNKFMVGHVLEKPMLVE